MPDHIITSQGIIHTQNPTYIDVSVERNGTTYTGRLYHELENPPALEEPVLYEQKLPLRSPDGKVLLLADPQGVWAYSRRVKNWQVFDWEKVARVHGQIISREHGQHEHGS